jgi:hypothetical protein
MDNEKMQQRQEYLDSMRFLSEGESRSFSNLEKSLLVLTTGALALSVTFLQVVKGAVDCLDIAVIAWIFWVMSLTSQLASYYLSARAFREEQEIISEQYRKREPQVSGRTNIFTPMVHTSNQASISLFILGAIIFLLFVYRTLS